VLVTLSVNASREADLAGAGVNAPAANDAADGAADAAPPADDAAAGDQADGAAGEDGYGAEDANAGDQADQPAPAAPANNLNITFAGRVKGGKATVAITAKGDQAIAYVCDGKNIESWLQGSAADGKLDLSSKDSTDALTGTFTKGRAKGTITVGDQQFTFDVAKATKPSGFYRTAADVRGARVVGGWIVLADGTQVGLASFAGTSVPAPRLDVQSGRATVFGADLTASPANPGDAW
jgi:serine/threonine-protein kinase